MGVQYGVGRISINKTFDVEEVRWISYEAPEKCLGNRHPFTFHNIKTVQQEACVCFLVSPEGQRFLPSSSHDCLDPETLNRPIPGAK